MLFWDYMKIFNIKSMIVIGVIFVFQFEISFLCNLCCRMMWTLLLWVISKGSLNVNDIMICMRNVQRTNFNSLIGGLCMKPHSKSRLSPSFCRLIPLPLVRLVLEVDVQLLKNEFVNGYQEGDRVLYVSPYDKDGNLAYIKKSETWGEYWWSCNDKFEHMLKNNKDYEKFRGEDVICMRG